MRTVSLTYGRVPSVMRDTEAQTPQAPGACGLGAIPVPGAVVTRGLGGRWQPASLLLSSPVISAHLLEIAPALPFLLPCCVGAPHRPAPPRQAPAARRRAEGDAGSGAAR